VGECWGEGTATVLILGDRCTRGCAFCNVASGTPGPPDEREPARVARAAAELGWTHVVVTSVTRDDLEDGGASQFVAVLQELRKRAPAAATELLVPDFGGNRDAIRRVVGARPDVLAHNVETVPRLYDLVRPGAIYRRSLDLLGRAHDLDPRLETKSGLMVGLGESREEAISVMEDLRAAGCSSLTIGQYLAPSRNHLPIREFLSMEAFSGLAEAARKIGFARVAAGPLVRSSYRAGSRHGSPSRDRNA
jgi:lipoic acid synthetase